jgi:hypothetical protein
MRKINRPRVAVAIGLLALGVMGSVVASQRTATAMATATSALLNSLNAEQRQKMALPLDSADRTRWNFVPTSMFPRQGLPLKDMTEPQRKLAHELLRTALSQRGYAVTTSIMTDLEAILRDTEAAARAAQPGGGRGGGQVRDPELYFFSVFGTPGAKAPWAWRVEGHHVSLHFTLDKGTAVVAAPTFLGSNPAEVREGPKKGFRALDREQDAGRALVMALDDSQRKTAIFSETAPKDIITMTSVTTGPLFGNESFGEITLTDALTNSVNTVWANVGEELGAETMVEYMERFGFYSRPEFDYPEDQVRASGPTKTNGRLATEGFDVGRVAIGQGGAEGQMLATPLQMAMVAATVGNDGVQMRPTFLQEVKDPDGRVTDELDPDEVRRVISEESAAQLTQMMINVTEEGTASGLSVGGAQFAGKTGTAERDNAGLNQPWFVLFAPAEDPQIAVAATIESCQGCSGGQIAGPIATAVAQDLLG